MLRVDNELRDAGETSRSLASDMYDYLMKEDARGFLATVDSPVTERLCKRFGMTRLESPVYGFMADKKAEV